MKLSAEIRGLLCVSIVLSAGFFAGIFAGYYPLITIDWELSIGDILGTISGFLIALFIAHAIEGKGADYRNEKDLILRRSEVAHDLIKELCRMISTESCNYLDVLARFKSLSISLNGLGSCLNEHGYSKSHRKNTAAFTSYINLHQFLTGDEKQGLVRNNILTLTASDQGVATALGAGLDNDLYELQLLINRGK